MKKALFIVFAVAGFSQFSFAQEAARMSPAPTQAETKKATEAKLATKQEVAATQASEANYKKAGLDENQIAAVNRTNSLYDSRKAKISNDTKLTAEQKKSQLSALEIEKNAAIRKGMGEDSYKRYTELNSPASKTTAPAKKTAKTSSTTALKTAN